MNLVEEIDKVLNVTLFSKKQKIHALTAEENFLNKKSTGCRHFVKSIAQNQFYY